ncbi:lysine transporter LysE [Streptomyces fradiae]|uniref:lysine transporter LysE n=1 Tax=Streptomyces fradiae TaxID=1906 RepID=UPI003514E9B7
MRFLKEFVGEFVGELILQVLAYGLLIGLAFVFFWGWSISPLVTGGVTALAVAFTGYGAWETFRGSARRRKGRLAGAAVIAFGGAAFLALYAIDFVWW